MLNRHVCWKAASDWVGRLVVCGAAVTAFFGCGSAKQTESQQTVIVLAAASTTDAIDEVAALFEQQNPGVEITISTGPSNGLAQQIMAGAPADVFLSANKKWAEAIVEEGLSDEIVELLTNRMVLIVPQGNPAGVTGPSDLVSERVSRVAIAGENVPAGIYAEQALRNLQLLEPLQKSNKLARGSDVRVTLTYVERSEAEAGIVYATDARISDQVDVVAELDPQTYEPVVYPAVLLKSAAGNDAARTFFRFLASAEAQAVFGRYGFTPLDQQSHVTL